MNKVPSMHFCMGLFCSPSDQCNFVVKNNEYVWSGDIYLLYCRVLIIMLKTSLEQRTIVEPSYKRHPNKMDISLVQTSILVPNFKGVHSGKVLL